MQVGDEVTMEVHLKNNTTKIRTGRVIEIPKHGRFAVVSFVGCGLWGPGNPIGNVILWCLVKSWN